MKRKALEKTIIDIIKIIGGIIGWFACTSITLYLFTMIPYWVVDSIGLFEKYADYPAGPIYFIEFLIIVGIICSISFIRELYSSNLKKIKNEKLNEQCITGKSGSGCAYTDKMIALYDENMRDIEET